MEKGVRLSTEGFADLRAALCEGLEMVSPRWEKLLGSWRQTLRGMGLTEEDIAPVTLTDPECVIRWFQETDLSLFRKQVLAVGDSFILLGLNYYQVVGGLNSLLDIYLSNLNATIPSRPRIAWTAARLYLLVTQILAMGYARHSDAQRLLRENETRSLSDELYDGIAHDLAALKLHLEGIDGTLKKAKLGQARSELQESVRLASRAFRSTRRAILELGPAIVRTSGLIPAVRIYIRQFSAQTGINIELNIKDSPEEIPLKNQIMLYRAMQKALDDIPIGDGTPNVEVLFRRRRETVSMELALGGSEAGAPRRKGPQKCYHLGALRGSIEALGGELHIHRPLAGGSTKRRSGRIEVRVPVFGTGRPHAAA